MKKSILLIITMFIALSVQAAGGLNSIFDKAIKKGRSNNGKGVYSIQFPKSKNVQTGEVLQFMRSKKYILTQDYTTRRMIRFGYFEKGMNYLEFIPESELESFIAEMPQTSTIGKAVIYPNSRKETVDVYWSGNVNNGWINGNGIGYTKLNNSMYIVRGGFDNGIPSGICEVVTATPHIEIVGANPPANLSTGAQRLTNSDKRSASFSVGNLNNGCKSLYLNGKYGFINERGDIVASCKYGKIVQEFNNSGYAIVTDPSDDNQEIKIDKQGSKLGYSDNQLRINEEKRLAKIAEEKRVAEEKRRKELKEQDEALYSALCQSVYENYQKMVDLIYEYVERFPEGEHISDVLQYKAAHEKDKAEAEANKNPKKWSKGDKICYRDYKNGLVCGVLQSWNENRTKAKLKIISGEIYNGQTTMILAGEPIYKDKEIWIGTKDGWHGATKLELHQLSESDNLQGMPGGGGSFPSNVYAGNSSNPKLNSVGQQIYWDETVSFSVKGQGVEDQGVIIGLFNKATGMDRASYKVRYTGIVEAVIGDTSVKCIITSAQIIDNLSTCAWQHKREATSRIQEDVGKTRVKQLNEFELK